LSAASRISVKTAAFSFASDGSPLQTILDSEGNMIGLTGTSKAGPKYEAWVETVSAQLPARLPTVKRPWLIQRVCFSQDGDVPLVLGFAYCPSSLLMRVFVSRGPIRNMIEVDYADVDPYMTAALVRTLTYYGRTYSTQRRSMSSFNLDPNIYLPFDATLYPFADRINYFGPVLDSMLSGPQQQQLETLAGWSPLQAISGAPYMVVREVSKKEWLMSVSGAVTAGLGNFAAGFITTTGTTGPRLIAGAIWGGFGLAAVIGGIALYALLDYEYEEWKKKQQFIESEGGGSSHGSVPGGATSGGPEPEPVPEVKPAEEEDYSDDEP
jgi:hypothetical protein